MIESIPTWQALLFAVMTFAVGFITHAHWREVKWWRTRDRHELMPDEYWRQRVCLETLPLVEFAQIDTEPLEWLIAEEGLQRSLAKSYRKELSKPEDAAAKRAGGGA